MRWSFAGGVVLMLAAAGTVRGQAAGTLGQEREAAANAPAGVTFRLKMDKAVYHLGERIGMTYEVTGAAGGGYRLDAGTQDRSGRMFEDTMHLEPEAVDPLAGYFRYAGFRLPGGVRPLAALGEKQVELHFDLNYWRRIDNDGTYQLFVTARRVMGPGEKAAPVGTAVSAIVTFQVLPADAEWSAGQLREIQQILGAPANGQADARREAVRRLRFLDTPGALLELARRLDGSVEDEWDLQAGLVGARDLRGALAALEKRLVAADQAVTPAFMETLELVAVMAAPRGGFFPPPPQIEIQRETERLMHETLKKYVPMLRASLVNKRGRALAVSLATLSDLDGDGEDELATDAGQRADFAAAFDLLPANQQVEMLGENWWRVRTPELLPHLLAIVADRERVAALAARGQVTRERWNEIWAALNLRSWALVRAYDLDPVKVRPLVIAEMKNPVSWNSGGYGIQAQRLMVLPDKALPEMDGDFLRLLDSRDSDVEDGTVLMIARYGSAALERAIRARFGEYAEGPGHGYEPRMIAYFLRVDPAFGREQFQRGLASRKDTGWWRNLFEDVGREVWTPELEQMAIEALDNHDGEIPMSAARMLARKGSAQAKGALMAALGRKYVANPPADAQAPKDGEKARRTAIVEALLDGHAWVLTDEELAAVQAKAGYELREDIQPLAGRKELDVYVFPGRDGGVSAIVDEVTFDDLEGLEAKLALYPAGLALRFPQNGAWEPEVKAITAWAKDHGRAVE